MIFDVIRLMRVRQWWKNVFLLVPFVFSSSFLDIGAFENAVAAFVLFSLAASGVYIINDIGDRAADRLHPIKKERPLARGSISVGQAWFFALLFLGVSFAGSYVLAPRFFFVVAAYAALNFFYTAYGKHLFLLEMFIISLGYLLRVVAGAFAIDTILSGWILIVTFFISLFIITTKRIQELGMVSRTYKGRAVLELYTRPFLERIMFGALIITLMAYILYIIEVRNNFFLVTVFPVTYGMFRFLWLIEAAAVQTDDPTDIILKDRPLLYAIACFSIMVITLFTLFPDPDFKQVPGILDTWRVTM